jgi:outer membrane murein-binding lipoprotein Lpp
MALTLENVDQRVTKLEHAQGETTETLRWVVTKLARMQAVQDEHTLRLERLETKVDGLETKVDGLETKVDRLETKVDRLDTKVDTLETKVDTLETKVDALPRAIAEVVDASEKRIMAAIAGRA